MSLKALILYGHDELSSAYLMLQNFKNAHKVRQWKTCTVQNCIHKKYIVPIELLYHFCGSRVDKLLAYPNEHPDALMIIIPISHCHSELSI